MPSSAAQAGHRTDETLAFELRHRLSHGRPTDAEVLRQLALVEPDFIPIAVDVHRDDRVLQRRVGLLLEADAGLDRLERRMRADAAPYRGGSTRRDAAGGSISAAAHDWYTICQSGYRRNGSLAKW